MSRSCGDCQLCCRLLPNRELHKGANVKCQHQKFGVGCMIYERRPGSCRFWSCRWLVDDDTADQSRPDRSGYVIDVMPDFITVQPHDGSPPQHVEVVQVWVDPRRPDVLRDPKLRAYVERRGAERVAVLCRFGSEDAVLLVPPSMGQGEWREIRTMMKDQQHTPADIARALDGDIHIRME